MGYCELGANAPAALIVDARPHLPEVVTVVNDGNAFGRHPEPILVICGAVARIVDQADTGTAEKGVEPRFEIFSGALALDRPGAACAEHDPRNARQHRADAARYTHAVLPQMDDLRSALDEYRQQEQRVFDNLRRHRCDRWDCGARLRMRGEHVARIPRLPFFVETIDRNVVSRDHRQKEVAAMRRVQIFDREFDFDAAIAQTRQPHQRVGKLALGPARAQSARYMKDAQRHPHRLCGG